MLYSESIAIDFEEKSNLQNIVLYRILGTVPCLWGSMFFVIVYVFL